MHMSLLYPGDPAEALTLGRHAIAMSRATGLWVAVKIVADVADGTAAIELDPEAFDPIIPDLDGRPYVHQPDGRLLTPHTLELEQEIVEVRYELARRYAADNRLNHLTVDPPDAWIGIAASGITYREVREALRRLGLRTDGEIADVGIRLLKMGMPMPFNVHIMRNFARGLREVLVIEEKQPNIESLVKDALYGLPHRPLVVGKADEDGTPLFPAWGALDADTILPLLRSRLESTIGDRLTPETPQRQRISIPLTVNRTPFYCSGCPHNRSTQVPEGAMVGAGIGCHTMTLLMDSERVGDIVGITCMGNEGVQWIGMAPFLDSPHIFQNLGDGTFFHSGQLAIQAAVHAGVDMTYKLLYNGTVAMTGGQDPEGQQGIPDICRVLVTQGVARVLITTDDTDRYRGVDLPDGVDVWPRQRLIEAHEVLAATAGVTVLIHDQRCAAELRRDRKRGVVPTPRRRVVINPRICEGCGDCGQVSNCLSVQPVTTPFGPRTRIDQTTCNLDYSCLEGDCPSFMTIETSVEPADTSDTPAAPSNLPDPVIDVEDFAMRITGIGGTGVVTVSQILGTAAMLDGYDVRGLDQIGLSQKAGPVVSDIRLSRSAPSATSRIGHEQADLLLAFDQLVAAGPRGLLTADPDRTAVVGSSSATPTGEMITHLDVHPPSADELARRIAEETRADAQLWADAQQITADLLGSSTSANIFVVGMAVQAGHLPLSPAMVERAIELNGVAVAANIEAFRWGRTHVADPDRLESALSMVKPAEATTPPSVPARIARRISGLGLAPAAAEHLTLLAAELIAWGDTGTASLWLDGVERVREAEREAIGDGSSDLTEAVARNLYKLSAYKDEYEVARLMTDEAALTEARQLAGPGGSITWKLHPPVLRAMGLHRKIGFRSWTTPAIRMLARGKRLRGTRLDPFGRARVRRVERELPGGYVNAIDQVLSRLTPLNHPTAVAIAELPDIVRGFEHIKLQNVERYRAALAEALATL